MPADKPNRKAAARKRRLAEAIDALTALQFGSKQRNETAAYTLLALLDLQPDAPWADAQAPLRGLKGINLQATLRYLSRFHSRSAVA